MKLISMTDFVITQWSVNLTKTQRERIRNYANFLKQPLELCMFVPCDEKGNVLEEPKKEAVELAKGVFNYSNYNRKFEKYQQAKERCLFEGFDIEKANIYIELFSNIEALSNLNKKMQLTKTAIKQIGL